MDDFNKSYPQKLANMRIEHKNTIIVEEMNTSTAESKCVISVAILLNVMLIVERTLQHLNDCFNLPRFHLFL